MLKPENSQTADAHIHKTSRKSFNKRLLARKQMTTIFWDRKRVLMEEFVQYGTTLMLEVYCETLKRTA
jgi:hypothetical protein